MDDIYIYHVYILSLLLTMFQKKRRRGRLCFQERGNDKDMISLDMTNNTIISSTFDQENGEMASRTTSIQEGEDDEDIPAIDTTTTPTPKKDQKVLSFMRVVPNIHDNVMLPKSELCGSLRNDGQCMDERDNFRSMFTHGDGRINMIRCCSRSSPTSLWIQEKLESQFFMLWTQIRTAEIDLNSICYNFRIRTPNGVNLFFVRKLVSFTFQKNWPRVKIRLEQKMMAKRVRPCC